MRKRLFFVIMLISSLCFAADERKVKVDFFILFDTSLSMEPVIQDARLFAAENVIAPLVEVGDWLGLVEFFGSTNVLIEKDIASESDKVECIKVLRSLKADGAYTDIGNALDALDAMIRKRGFPERPKYILMISDERQEAPKNTKYYSETFIVTHPLLQYVKRIAKNGYSVITIGYGISSQVDAFAQTIFTTLTDPPPRPLEILPGATPEEKQSALLAASQGESLASQESQDSIQLAKNANTGLRAVGSSGYVLIPALAGAGGLVLLSVLLLLRRRSKKKEESKTIK